MKGSFTDGFLFLPNRVFHGVHVFCHIRHMGYRFLLLPDLQIYHRADIGRDLTPDAGATLIHGVIPCALRDTCISPATNVCPTSQSTRQKIYPAFGCAHWAACISTRFSASRTLCARICCFDLRFNGFGVFDFSSIYYAWCKMLNIFFEQN